MDATIAPPVFTVPLLVDLTMIAHRMCADERAQFAAFSGIGHYDPEATALALMNTRGPKYLMTDASGAPLVAGGFDPVRPGVYNAWLACTDRGWSEHGRALTRFCRRQCDALLAGGAHRIEVTALASRTRAHEWYERAMLMRREGVHPGYGAGRENAITFARVAV